MSYLKYAFLLFCTISLMLGSAPAIDEDMERGYTGYEEEGYDVYAYYSGPATGTPTPTTTFGAYPTTPSVTPSVTLPGTPAMAYPPMTTPAVKAYPGAPSGTPASVYTTIAPPSTQQNVLLSYSIGSAPPPAVYYRGTYIPWSTFSVTFPATQPMMWTNTNFGWAWYTTCPLGGWIQQLMYVPTRGTLKLYELYPDGHVQLYSYGWAYPGYKYIWFYADTPGRHISLITVTDKPSNYITIDVV